MLLEIAGDSGGPLLVGDPVTFLAGITSFGNCETDSPEVYTRVSEFIGWIQNVVLGFRPDDGNFVVDCRGCPLDLPANFSCQVNIEAPVPEAPKETSTPIPSTDEEVSYIEIYPLYVSNWNLKLCQAFERYWHMKYIMAHHNDVQRVCNPLDEANQ